MLDSIPLSISVTLLSEWLTLSDLSRVDVAYCNHARRKDFLHVLSQPGFATSGNSSVWLDSNYFRWLTSRKIRVTALHIREIHIFLQYNLFVPESLRYLRALSIDHLSHSDVKLMESAVRSATQLRELRVRRCRSATSLFAILSLTLNLRLLDISGCAERITDQILHHLQRSPDLQTLNVSNCLFSEEQVLIDAISICSNVVELICSQCLSITDSVFHNLRTLRKTLVHFDMNGCELLTDTALESILSSGCDQLQTLCIGGKNKITATSLLSIAHTNWPLTKLDLTGYWALDPYHVERMVDAFPDITCLVLGGCSRLTDATLIYVASHYEDLTYLDINYCYKISDASIMCLAACCRRLRSLNLSYCNRLTDLSVACLLDHCRDLTELSLACCTHVTDEAVMQVAECTSDLHSLNLSGCNSITDVGVLGVIAGCQKLRSLEISDNQNITDDVIMAVGQRAKRLKFLNVAYCNGLSDDALELLKKTRRTLEVQSLRYLSY